MAYFAMKNFARAARVAGMVYLIASIMIGAMVKGKKTNVLRPIDNQFVCSPFSLASLTRAFCSENLRKIFSKYHENIVYRQL